MWSVSVILAVSILVIIGGGLHNRWKLGKGIGWQFIRFIVLSISIPTVALLAINGALSGEAATVIGAAMGYAFGRRDDPDE